MNKFTTERNGVNGTASRIKNFSGIYIRLYKLILIKKQEKLIKIVYQINNNLNRTVFKNSEMVTESLYSKIKIEEPTHHPFHDYSYAPDLDCLLIED